MTYHDEEALREDDEVIEEKIRFDLDEGIRKIEQRFVSWMLRIQVSAELIPVYSEEDEEDSDEIALSVNLLQLL